MLKEIKEKVAGWLPEEEIKENEPMSKHTTFKVGGPAGLFLSIRSEEILAQIVRYLSEKGTSYFLLGNGSNLLVGDKGYPGVVLFLEKEFSYVTIEENKMIAGASTLLSKISSVALENGLTGLEFSAGIPGYIGGGTVMNAGAYGGELSQIITSVKVMDEKGQIKLLNKEELEFGYRTSIFKKSSYIILEVTMELKKGDKEVILGRMQEYQKARKEKQPLEYPSAGSTFKRPPNHFAGKLIMDAGFRGYKIGGAKVSEKHCGFIINEGKATATDILLLIEKIQETVKEKFGVELEPEVIRIGE